MSAPRRGEPAGVRGVVLAFWLVPLAAFSALTLAGHPPVVGDGTIQNYPLRELVGALLRHGRLPLWDPYLWSGTPLLAGSNAGAAFPGSWLFAVLPAAWAWVVNLDLVYAGAATGLLLLLRDVGVGRPAAVAGAVTFAFAGFLPVQLEHLGLIQGTALLPWLLLALRRCRFSARGRVGLGLVVALILTTGEPRAVTTAAVAGALGLVDTVLRARDRLRYLATALVAVAGGVLLAAGYWLPAYEWANASQRAHLGFAFFSSGSLLPIWLVLFVVPFVMGAPSGLWHGYVGPYNSSELLGYVGVLPLVAAGALLFPAERRATGRRTGLWYALVAVGLLLALGGNVPGVGHLLASVPVYGQERLQSRNLALVDLGLAGLLAVWADHVFAQPVRRERPSAPRLAWYAVPLVVAVGVGVVAWAAPGSFARAMTAPLGPFTAQPAYIVFAVALAAGAGLLAAGASRLGVQARRRLVLGFVALDVATTVAAVSWLGYAPAAAADSALGRSAERVVVAAGGRFAVWSPGGPPVGPAVGTPVTTAVLRDLGVPDINVVRRWPSVQGYGSVVASGYERATGTHAQWAFAPAALADGTFDRLDLTVLFAPAAALLQPAATTPWSPVALRPGQVVTRFLGPPVPVAAVRLSTDGSAPPPRVGLRLPGGVRWGAVRAAGPGRWLARFAGGPRATAVLVAPTGPGRLTDLVLLGSGVVRPAGPLAADLQPPHWRYETTVGPFAVYLNAMAAGPVTAVPASAARVTATVPTAPWQDQMLTVDAVRPVLVVRAEAYAPGWQATLSGAGGSRRVRVARVGLAQAVAVPTGRWTVRFTYRPSGVRTGGWLSLAGVAVLLATALVRRPPTATARG